MQSGRLAGPLAPRLAVALTTVRCGPHAKIRACRADRLHFRRAETIVLRNRYPGQITLQGYAVLPVAGSNRLRKKVENCHSERRVCAKNPSWSFVFNREGFFASLRMTTKALFPQPAPSLRHTTRPPKQLGIKICDFC